MLAPLLKTKLYIPPIRPELVPRPRLIERLNAGLHRKLTLVSAPAGFGKTTLLSEWVQSLKKDGPACAESNRSPVSPQVCWLSLDEGDNDPMRFWMCFITALQTVQPEMGQNALAMFKSPQPVPVEASLVTLVNEITSFTLESQDELLVLVLDDLHLVEAVPIHEGLAFLLDRLPPPPQGLHMVITTRVDPPIRLARLRARGQATELHGDDLRFTLDEAAAFLSQATGLALSPQALRALEERTEGWVTGLQMASIALQSTIALQSSTSRGTRDMEHVGDFIEAFTRSNRYALEYLWEEVLSQEAEEVQAFLLYSSILDRLSGALCDAVIGRSGSQALLEKLESSNLFIVPLDHERHWYRYHQLFAELLRTQLVKLHAESLPTLHGRASEWYERNGLPVEAINHALAAGDAGRAARLLEQHALELLESGEVITLVRWLEELPNGLLRSRPWLCIVHAWVLILGGDAAAIESRLRDAEEALPGLALSSDQERRIRGYISAIRAQVAFIKGAIPETIELAYDALEKVPAADHSVRATTVLILGSAYGHTGNFADAIRAFDQGKAISQASGNYFHVMLTSCARAQIEVAQGQLHKAACAYRAALQLVEGSTRRVKGLFPGLGYPYVGLADVLREWNELEEAAHYAEEGVKLCQLLGQAEISVNGYVTLARVRRARGDLDGALTTLQEARRHASELSTWSVALVAAHQARLWLTQDDVRAASRWAQENGLGVGDALYFSREAGHLSLARVLIAQDQLDDALAFLARLLEAAEAGGRLSSVIEILALQALALHKQARLDQALPTLERALVLAEGEGYMRIFLDEADPMGALLHQAALHGITPAYIDKLLAAFGMQKPKPATSTAFPPSPSTPFSSPLVEPLSERELEVLQLVALGQSNQEIAGQLCVSINTIKAHLKSLNRKLDVHNRTQAVGRARELKLL
ncbi:MAG: hypothetical protein JW850_04510 [Thermoflexales bacterium]|nr:hypothetical protein [Thermoflexales bacterium]